MIGLVVVVLDAQRRRPRVGTLCDRAGTHMVCRVQLVCNCDCSITLQSTQLPVCVQLLTNQNAVVCRVVDVTKPPGRPSASEHIAKL